MYILAKAEQNLRAASLLIDSQLYAPSIHCSYYAGFQMSKRKLLEDGLTYEQQEEYAKQSKTDSHNHVINATENCVSDSVSYRHNILKLKRLRKKSDYQNLEITQPEAIGAREAAHNILKILT